MENKKITTVVGIVILIIIVGTIVYFVQKAKDSNVPTPTPAPTPAATQAANPKPAAANGTETLEGTVMAISEKDVKIDVAAPEPEFIGISAATPVVKLKNDKTETPGGLADVISGVKVKVSFKTNAETKLKVAEKIFVLEK
jgi:hypothetical protein